MPLRLRTSHTGQFPQQNCFKKNNGSNVYATLWLFTWPCILETLGWVTEAAWLLDCQSSSLSEEKMLIVPPPTPTSIFSSFLIIEHLAFRRHVDSWNQDLSILPECWSMVFKSKWCIWLPGLIFKGTKYVTFFIPSYWLECGHAGWSWGSYFGQWVESHVGKSRTAK